MLEETRGNSEQMLILLGNIVDQTVCSFVCERQAPNPTHKNDVLIKRLEVRLVDEVDDPY